MLAAVLHEDGLEVEGGRGQDHLIFNIQNISSEIVTVVNISDLNPLRRRYQDLHEKKN